MNRAGLRTPLQRIGVAALLIATGACTGTFQPGAPLALLVVRGSEGATSQVLGYAVEAPGPATPRDLRALGPSTLTPEVDGPIVALDWLDRDETGAVGLAGRSVLLLLVAERTSAPGQRAARLFAYDTADFDIAAPAELEPVEALSFALVAGGVLAPEVAVREGVLAPDPGVCLGALSVSRTGRFVALLDARSRCDPDEPATDNFLLLIDTESRELVFSTVAEPVRGAAPLIDQGAERLEYVTDTVGTVLRRLSLHDLDAVVTSEALPNVGPFDPVLAFGRHGTDRLIVAGQQLHVVDANGSVTSTVPTRQNARGFVETDAAAPVVLRALGALVVHATPTDEDPATLAVTYLDGVSDLPDQMSYLLRAGAIDTFDLLLYDPTATAPAAAARTSYPAPELTEPRAITFFRPRPAAP